MPELQFCANVDTFQLSASIIDKFDIKDAVLDAPRMSLAVFPSFSLECEKGDQRGPGKKQE